MASAEKSEGSRSHETDEVDEDGRAAVEQDREQQRQKISQWKVLADVTYLLCHLFIITVIDTIFI